MASTNNASLKPIKLYHHAMGPNPWKIVMAFKELQLPYTEEFVDFSLMKSEPYISVNPNGRVPAIEDPNTGITLWESGAILIYLVSTYDKNHLISFAANTTAAHHANQWLFFQTSGQGPYMGQAAWFANFHHEKLPSAISRYQDETVRVIGVIDGWLKKTGQKYLVADEEHKEGKYTFADLSFVPWGANVPWVMGKNVFENGQFADYKAWMDRVCARPAVKAALEHKAELAKKAH